MLWLYTDPNHKSFMGSYNSPTVIRTMAGSWHYHSVSSIRNRSQDTAIMVMGDPMGQVLTVPPGRTLPDLRQQGLDNRLDSLRFTGAAGRALP
jgi:hypothetical protein